MSNMGDTSATGNCKTPDVSIENMQKTNAFKTQKELCEKVEERTVDTLCRGMENVEKDNAKIFKEPAKAKLRFGIEAILNVKDRHETVETELDVEVVRDKSDIYVYDDADRNDSHLEKFKQQFERSYMDSMLSKEEDDEDDDDGIETETKDFKDLKLDLDIARARLAYMGYAASLPSTCLTETGSLSLQPNSFSPPFPVNNAGYPWTAVGDLRKERFSMVRRIGHPYQNRTPPKRKKPRTSFTRLQILELEKRFERQKYLASTERSALAKTLKMTDAQVKTWFQNRRTKWRRQTAEEREIERQAANRLLLSLQTDSAHRKSMVMSPESVCLSHLQRWQEKRAADI